MVLGALTCPQDSSRIIARQIKTIKKAHGLSRDFEIKWTKVSPAKVDFYMDLLKFFYSEPQLTFRAVIIPDKTRLRHNDFNHDHDTWYYKMYFTLIKVLLNHHDHYCIYLDIKDSRSGPKVKKLRDFLSNNDDSQPKIIERLHTIRSHEAEQMQLADLLIGCILAANRNENTMSSAKETLVKAMRKLSGHYLNESTLVHEKKVNLFRWEAAEILHE